MGFATSRMVVDMPVPPATMMGRSQTGFSRICSRPSAAKDSWVPSGLFNRSNVTALNTAAAAPSFEPWIFTVAVPKVPFT